MLSGWGSTEVGPGATIVQTADSEPGWVGPPLPGVTIRLVPVADKLELRVKGPSVMPGYWRDPERTAAVFDEDGFYRSGDAGRLVDELRPELGLRFDGRIADDFKLANGSWVNVDRLRSSLLACAGTGVRDVVVAGPDRLPSGGAVLAVGGRCPSTCKRCWTPTTPTTSGQTNVIVAGVVLDYDPAADLLSAKGLIKPAVFRAAESARIDALYRTPRTARSTDDHRQRLQVSWKTSSAPSWAGATGWSCPPTGSPRSARSPATTTGCTSTVNAASAEGPFGDVIAHGFLLLSLVTGLANQCYDVQDAQRWTNYGLDRVRFTAPVTPSDSVRLVLTLREMNRTPTGFRLVLGCELELKGSARPAMVADWIVLITERVAA